MQYCFYSIDFAFVCKITVMTSLQGSYPLVYWSYFTLETYALISNIFACIRLFYSWLVCWKFYWIYFSWITFIFLRVHYNVEITSRWDEHIMNLSVFFEEVLTRDSPLACRRSWHLISSCGELVVDVMMWAFLEYYPSWAQYLN